MGALLSTTTVAVAIVFGNGPLDVQKSSDRPPTSERVAAADADGEVPLWNIATRGNTWVFCDVEKLRGNHVIESAMSRFEQQFAGKLGEKLPKLRDGHFAQLGLTTANLKWIAAAAVVRLRYDDTKPLGHRNSFNFAVSGTAAKFIEVVDWPAVGKALDETVFPDKFQQALQTIREDEERKSFGEALTDDCHPQFFGSRTSLKPKKGKGFTDDLRMLRSAAHDLRGEQLHQAIQPCTESVLAIAHVCDEQTDVARAIGLSTVMQSAKIITLQVDFVGSGRDVALKLNAIPRDTAAVAELHDAIETFIGENRKAELWPKAALLALEHGTLSKTDSEVVWQVIIRGVFAAPGPAPKVSRR